MDAFHKLYASGGNEIPEVPWMGEADADRRFLFYLREEDIFYAHAMGIQIFQLEMAPSKPAMR
jgi:hypothetical protein